MIILYISIFLVVLGFVFIITSVEKRKTVVVDNDAHYLPPVLHKDISSHTEQHAQAEIVSAEAKPEAETAIVSPQSQADIPFYEVILYADESGVSLDKGSVDASNLKNLSREGRGIAEVTRDALTVRVEKKLYRFDYYRLDRVTGRNECVVLSLKGSKGAFIMISELPAFYDRVYSQFSQFHG